MKSLSLFCLFLLLFFCSNILNAQVISQVNSKALQAANDIDNGINLNNRDYQEVYQAYLEYESRLASLAVNQGSQTGGMFGNKKDLLIISLQKNVKSKLNNKKFILYLSHTNQQDLTNMVDPIKQKPTVSLSGDNANPNPPTRSSPTVTLYEN